MIVTRRSICRTSPSICVSFFFSRTRRHTRFDCDWSSDVCSSDLDVSADSLMVAGPMLAGWLGIAAGFAVFNSARVDSYRRAALQAQRVGQYRLVRKLGAGGKIGRAACRGRVAMWGGGGAWVAGEG